MMVRVRMMIVFVDSVNSWMWMGSIVVWCGGSNGKRICDVSETNQGFRGGDFPRPILSYFKGGLFSSTPTNNRITEPVRWTPFLCPCEKQWLSFFVCPRTQRTWDNNVVCFLLFISFKIMATSS